MNKFYVIDWPKTINKKKIVNLHLPHYNFTVEFLQCILTHFHRQRTEITPHSSLRDKNTWLPQHYSDSDHHNWHFFFFLTISDQIIGRCGDFKTLPWVRLVTETDGRAAACLTAGQWSSLSVRKTCRRPTGQSVSQIITDADGQPASVSACVQCISSLSITESNPTMLNHINWPGSNATAVVLNLFENNLKKY